MTDHHSHEGGHRHTDGECDTTGRHAGLTTSAALRECPKWTVVPARRWTGPPASRQYQQFCGSRERTDP
jgi:hypothetical protein